MAKTIPKKPEQDPVLHDPVEDSDELDDLVRREDGPIPPGRNRVVVRARVIHVGRGTPAWENPSE